MSHTSPRQGLWAVGDATGVKVCAGMCPEAVTRLMPVLPQRATAKPVRTRVAGRSIVGVRIGVALGVLLLAGCAAIERSWQADAPPAAAAPALTAAPAPAAAESGTRAESPRGDAEQRVTIEPEPSTPPTEKAGSGVAPRNTARPAAPVKQPEKVAPSQPAITQAAKDVAAAALPAKPAATSTLDLKSLETRLKETKAIGVFTKIALKNQIDALLDQFRAYYKDKGGLKVTLTELRRSYDLLVLKVLALLQDADPPLASAIASSRESIWGILSNPAKFAAV